MCNKGRRQSPVNVEPDKLLFDPWLREIQFDKHKVSNFSIQYRGSRALVPKVVQMNPDGVYVGLTKKNGAFIIRKRGSTKFFLVTIVNYWPSIHQVHPSH